MPSEEAWIKSLTDEELDAEIFKIMDALPPGFFDYLAEDPDPAGRALYERIKGKRFSECSRADQHGLEYIHCQSLMDDPELKHHDSATPPPGW